MPRSAPRQHGRAPAGAPPGRNAPAPGLRDTHQRAAMLLEAGETRTAHALLSEALVLDRRNPDTLAMLGDTCLRLSRTSEAARHLRLAVQLRPMNALAVALLGEALSNLGEIGAAHRAADAYLAHDPRHPRVLAMKARLHQFRGHADQALQLLVAHLDDDDEHCVLHALFASVCMATHDHAKAIDRLRSALERVDIAVGARRSLLMHLGQHLDAVDDVDDAFAAFERANHMLDPVEPRDAEGVRAVWTPEVLAMLGHGAPSSNLPILIVGMPRSGTTITEQALAMHPAVGSAGESDLIPTLIPQLLAAGVTAGSVNALGTRYLEGLRAAAAPGQTRVIDKLPGNYLALGAICSALPKATIIQCTRDPRDVCLSCFCQDFGPRLPYTRRLDTCARAYLQHLEVMQHWRDTLPVTILESNYGQLVAAPRAGVARLLEHAGLPWHEACLEPHKGKSTVTTASVNQVRKPIYTSSSQRWRRYEKHLGPMLDVLAPVL